jgi:CreA protein
VFSEARSLLFKTIRVRRVLDREANALVYVSYSTRLTKGDDENRSRFRSSLCAIPLTDSEEDSAFASTQ